MLICRKISHCIIDWLQYTPISVMHKCWCIEKSFIVFFCIFICRYITTLSAFTSREPLPDILLLRYGPLFGSTSQKNVIHLIITTYHYDPFICNHISQFSHIAYILFLESNPHLTVIPSPRYYAIVCSLEEDLAGHWQAVESRLFSQLKDCSQMTSLSHL